MKPEDFIDFYHTQKETSMPLASIYPPCWVDISSCDGERHTLSNIAYRLSDEDRAAMLRADDVSWANYQTPSECEWRRRIQVVAQSIRDQQNRFNQEHREYFVCKIF